ncbi:MAG: Beta-hexosaminidase [Candidatus Erwinia impunctatus]
MLTILRRIIVAMGMCVILQPVAGAVNPLPLMPLPEHITQPPQGGALPLTHRLVIVVEGDDLDDAVARWRARIGRQTGWQMMPVENTTTPLVLTVHIQDKVDVIPRADSDESYQLKVNGHGIQLIAATRFGAIRGMETLLQLIDTTQTIPTIPYVEITDQPRFPWRGLLIDSARHFIPVETLRRQLDGMAAAKMNVFHWHLTDDQGWRFASGLYPQLQEKGSDGFFYTREQMKGIVRYAAERGIRVVPEIDMPGHVTALAVGMPELIAARGTWQIERDWGVFKPLLDPSNEQVYSVIDQLLSEVADIFPDEWIHIGGDEVDATQWKKSPNIQKFMQQKGLPDERALHAYFNQRVEKIASRYHRRIVGWDEIAHPDLPKTILVQSWRGQDALGTLSASNYQAILSAGFYLDQPQSAAYHYRNEIIPSGLQEEDQLQPDDLTQSWSFTLPRLKGPAVGESFTLIKRAGAWTGFIDFSGKSRRMLRQVDWLAPNKLTFNVDTWMGSVRPVLTLTANQLGGYMLIGNTRYQVTGHALSAVPSAIQPILPDPQQAKSNLLGGEAALWSEMVNAQNIDTRLWPRVFVVAERLWSDREVTDESNMYQRLQAVDRWSVYSAGLQHYAQQQTQMMRLANRSDIVPLQIFAQALEPAHYYTRLHLKYRAGHYDIDEPLNRLVDILPAESEAVRQLNQQVEALIANRGDTQAKQKIRQQLQYWQQNIALVMPILQQNAGLKNLLPVAKQIEQIAGMGLTLLNAMDSEMTFGKQDIRQMQATLDSAAEVQDELVVALVYPIEKLLQASN